MVPIEHVQARIFAVRGERVMLDADLAALFGVTTKALNQAVKRNEERFPPEFMFRLTTGEAGA
ncbi:MAG: ORF6N domain-containing protein, partial [Chloroflexi bacterium]|nr:ORF6N domain-containing protein [Chloroflexota bacterium]